MPRTRQLGLALRQMLPFSERRKGFGKDPRYRLSTRRRRHSVPFQLRDRSRFKISRTLLSPGPQPAPAPQFRSTALGSDLATFDPFTGRGEIEIANGFANNFADSVASYLANPGEVFLLDETAGRFNRAIAGDLEVVGSK